MFYFKKSQVSLLFLLFINSVWSQCPTDELIKICHSTTMREERVLNLHDGSEFTQVLNDLSAWSDANTPPGSILAIKSNIAFRINTVTNAVTLNLKKIDASGEYKYTYSTTGCPVANLTVSIGPYFSDPAATYTICNDQPNANAFGAWTKPIYINGTWSLVSATPVLMTPLLPRNLTGDINTTTFTNNQEVKYSYAPKNIPSSGCPNQTPKNFSIFIKPVGSPGIPKDMDGIKICTEDLSMNRSFDLFTLLVDESPRTPIDRNGQWDLVSGEDQNSNPITDLLGEISAPFDFTINLENLYNNYGVSEYLFQYVAPRGHPACSLKEAEVKLIIGGIPKLKRYTLNIDNNLLCEREVATTTFQATLNPTSIKTIGDYSIKYTISKDGSTTPLAVEFSDVSFATTGQTTFEIDKTNITTYGKYTIKLVELGYHSSHTVTPTDCSPLNISVEDINFDIDVIEIIDISPIIDSIDYVCQNTTRTDPAKINISVPGVTDNTYGLTYELTDPSSNTISETINIVLIAEKGTFDIPSTSLTIFGEYKVKIIDISSLGVAGCNNFTEVEETFSANPLPGANPLMINSSDNFCFFTPVVMNISGFVNDDTLEITYNLSGANTATNEVIEVNINVALEGALIVNPSFITSQGNTTITIEKIKNKRTLCESSGLTLSRTFEIFPSPPKPTAADQSFCKINNPTLINLNPTPVTGLYVWYLESDPTTPLADTYPLETSSYLVREINSATTCESAPEKIVVDVIDDSISPSASNQVFCMSDNPKIFNLYPISTGFYNVYQTETSSPAIDKRAGVAEGEYWITQLNPTGTCESKRAKIEVKIIDPGEKPDVMNQSFCKNENSTISSLLPDNFDFNWYDSALGTTPLNDSDLLRETTYWVSYNSTIGSCESERAELEVLFNETDLDLSISLKTFCDVEQATIADLEPNGENHKWFTTASDSTPLENDILLGSLSYWVEKKDPLTMCLSDRKKLDVEIKNSTSSSIPNQNPLDLKLCGGDAPKLIDLNQHLIDSISTITSSHIITWYDASNILLDENLLVEDNAQYLAYITVIDSSNNCNFQEIVAASIVDLTECDEDNYPLTIVDGFSPNGDGINDTFYIKNIKYVYLNYNLVIYNSFGKEIKTLNASFNKWNGQIDNKKAPTGIYYYTLDFNHGNKKAIQGRIFLNR